MLVLLMLKLQMTSSVDIFYIIFGIFLLMPMISKKIKLYYKESRQTTMVFDIVYS